MHRQYSPSVFGWAAVQGGALLYSQGTSWLLCNCTANPTLIDHRYLWKISIYTVFGMGIAQEITLKHRCVCAGTGFIFMVLTGLYIQISSWKHTGIFLPPMAAEITYCHHAIYQQRSFCIFTLQILLLLCLPILTSIRQWYQGDNWFFSVKQQPWGYQPSLKHPSGNWPQPLWHSNKGLSEPEPTCLLSPQHWR